MLVVFALFSTISCTGHSMTPNGREWKKGARLFFMVSLAGQEGTNWKAIILSEHLKYNVFFFLLSDTGIDCPNWSWSFCLWRCLKFLWTWAWKTCSVWSWSSRRLHQEILAGPFQPWTFLKLYNAFLKKKISQKKKILKKKLTKQNKIKPTSNQTNKLNKNKTKSKSLQLLILLFGCFQFQVT